MSNATFQAISPIDNQTLPGEFAVADTASMDAAVKRATAAFDQYRKKTKEEIAGFL